MNEFKYGEKLHFDIDVPLLRKLNPCKDPTAFGIKEDWKGTLVDILEMSQVKDEDKIWAVTKLLDEKTARLFAIDCARTTLKEIKSETPAWIKQVNGAINVAERFANGQATEAERQAAESAAWSAAESAAESAARSAAESAAESAARSAAWSAAWLAASSAAESAARSAAWSAASSAAESAAESAARSAAWSAQVTKLKEMLKGETKMSEKPRFKVGDKVRAAPKHRKL